MDEFTLDDLVECDLCGSWPGDACRDESGALVPPHPERLAMSGVTLIRPSDAVSAAQPKGGSMAKASDDADLAGAATQGLASVPEFEQGASQEKIEGTETTKVTFRGVNYDPLTAEENYKLGDEVEFTVRGRITEVGDRVMHDRGQQHYAKVDVTSVTQIGA